LFIEDGGILVVTTNFKNWRFIHVGFAVKDIEKAVKHYEDLGMGPFKPLNRSAKPKHREYSGKEIPLDAVAFNIRVGEMGPTIAELVQPLKGNCIQQEYLDAKGEGINHVAYEVDDIEQEKAEMEKLGYKVIQSSEFDNGEICLFFDTDKEGGVVTELIQVGK
jgi:methylmalonyl-CoA/ethylmalonyl-CoA epimerase